MTLSSIQNGLYSPSPQRLRQSSKLGNQAAPEGVSNPTKHKTHFDSPPLKKSTSNQYADQIIRPPSTRSSFTIDPTRELKAFHLDPKQSLISKTFLDIAHYEESFHLVDVFV